MRAAPSADRFYSPRNIPLWVCLVLALAIGVVGIAHHRAAAGPSAVQAAR